MTLCNLEGPMTTSTSLRPEREIYLKMNPKYVEVLKEASIECCNLANNHMLDYTEEGHLETRKVLEDAGIVWSDNSYYNVYEVKGVKIGMAGFNFTYERSVYYKYLKKEYTPAHIVIESSSKGSSEVTVPDSIWGVRVDELSDDVFKDSVKTVKLGKNVTQVGEGNSDKTFILPENVHSGRSGAA